MATIFIIDDDVSINEMLRTALTKRGFSVVQAYSGTEALLALSKAQPDLVLLDLGLPGLSGEDVLPKLGSVPVIVLSARASAEDKVSLLLGGAVDYVTKPFDLHELLARITVQLRGKGTIAETEIYSFGDITLHADTRKLVANGESAQLTRTEAAILRLLMQRPGQVVAKLTILDCISHDTPDCTEDSLKIHIHHLRRKIQSVTENTVIEAVWGIGYILKSEKS
ncbi:MAG: response regulator transcription factor [Lachnospiraceae bacterium]|nr:response regulator transcription factor [Lachnospiraceae bacterium]